MVLLDNDLNALLDSIQHAMKVPRYFGFGHAHLSHRFDHSASSVSESRLRRPGGVNNSFQPQGRNILDPKGFRDDVQSVLS